MIRSYMTLTTQSLGFFIAADALLIAYGLSQRKASIILMAALTVIGMSVALWRGAESMLPAACVAMRAERVLLPGQVTLVNTYIGLRLRAEREKLDAALDKNERLQESYRKVAVRVFLGTQPFDWPCCNAPHPGRTVRGSLDRGQLSILLIKARRNATSDPEPRPRVNPIAPWAAAQLRADQVVLGGLPHPVCLDVAALPSQGRLRRRTRRLVPRTTTLPLVATGTPSSMLPSSNGHAEIRVATTGWDQGPRLCAAPRSASMRRESSRTSYTPGMTAEAHQQYDDLHRLVDQLAEDQVAQAQSSMLGLVQQRRPSDAPTKPRRRLSFIGTLSAEPDLAERSEEILEEIASRNAE